MKAFYTFFLSVLLMSTSAMAQRACDIKREQRGYPMHYCACYEDRTNLPSLPIDVTITDSVWFKTTTNIFMGGMTASLYSETDVYFHIYQKCTGGAPLMDTVISSNRAFEIDSVALKKKLEANGVSTANMAIYICIYPKVEGIPSRVLCYPHGEGPASNCDEDILPIIPSMTFVSSNPEDVYELKVKDIPQKGDVIVEWFNSDADYCDLRISVGGCDIEPDVDVEIFNQYKIDRQLLDDALEFNESLYLNFSHPDNTTGRIRVSVKHETTTDCQEVETVATDARLILREDGMLYIERDGRSYTLTGQGI